MKVDIKTKVLALVTKAIFFYFVMVAISATVIDYKKIKFDTQIRSLNAVMPKSFNYLIKIRNVIDKNGEKNIWPYYVYYKNMSEYFKNKDDSIAMLGYCYFHMGKLKESVKAYEIAQKLNPNNVWHFYNLSILYYRLDQSDGLSEALIKGVSVSLNSTLESINSSKAVYRPIVMENRKFSSSVPVRFRQAVTIMNQMLVIESFRNKDYEQMRRYASEGVKKEKSLEEFYNHFLNMDNTLEGKIGLQNLADRYIQLFKDLKLEVF